MSAQECIDVAGSVPATLFLRIKQYGADLSDQNIKLRDRAIDYKAEIKQLKADKRQLNADIREFKANKEAEILLQVEQRTRALTEQVEGLVKEKAALTKQVDRLTRTAKPTAQRSTKPGESMYK